MGLSEEDGSFDVKGAKHNSEILLNPRLGKLESSSQADGSSSKCSILPKPEEFSESNQFWFKMLNQNFEHLKKKLPPASSAGHFQVSSARREAALKISQIFV